MGATIPGAVGEGEGEASETAQSSVTNTNPHVFNDITQIFNQSHSHSVSNTNNSLSSVNATPTPIPTVIEFTTINNSNNNSVNPFDPNNFTPNHSNNPSNTDSTMLSIN